MDTKTEIYNVGDLEIKLVCDFYFGDYLDTRVVINGQTLCTIGGTERNEFISELQELVNRFRI